MVVSYFYDRHVFVPRITSFKLQGKVGSGKAIMLVSFYQRSFYSYMVENSSPEFPGFLYKVMYASTLSYTEFSLFL